MAGSLHPYLIYTDGLSASEREALMDFLAQIAYIGPQVVAKTIGQNPQYIIYCSSPVDEFENLPFPCKFKWDNLAGTNLTKF